MGKTRLEILARIAILAIAAASAPPSARAGEHRHHGCCGSACLGPPTYALTSAGVFPPDRPQCYAIPILAVYQFPAVMARQPGSSVVWLQFQPDPMAGQLGGQPYLYHP
jgi:hypothetical protein